MIDEGRETMDEGRETMDEGRETIDEGRETIDEGRETMDEGRETIDEGRETMAVQIVCFPLIFFLSPEGGEGRVRGYDSSSLFGTRME